MSSEAGPARLSGEAPAAAPAADPVRQSRASVAFNGLLGATLVLVLLVIFIAQNTATVRISFLWLDGHLPLGVALLIAAIAGALLIGLAGLARILQLRKRARRLMR